MRLGIKEGVTYRLLGQTVHGSMSVTVGEREALTSYVGTKSWYEITLMDEENRSLD